jgi:hypothetical protein
MVLRIQNLEIDSIFLNCYYMKPSINEVLLKLEEQIPFFGSVNEKISLANVGWHVEHCLLVIIKICETINTSDPNKYKWKFNLKWLIILITRSLPRGKAKAPPAVIPGEVLTESSLRASIQLARKSIDSLISCHPDQYFYHPFFGKMNRNTTLVFFSIHTNHHLKIISDILDQ